jgi:hypothetical protein
MVEAIASRISSGLAARKHADVRVAELQAIADANASLESNSPSTIKQISPWESILGKASTGTEKHYQQTLKFLQASLQGDYTTGYTDPPERYTWEGTKTYAEVLVDDKVVAVIDNQGVVRTDNALGAGLHGKLIGSVNGRNGPDLAQARAEQIAKMLGGNMRKADTAITQQRFSQLEMPPRPEPILDLARMEADSRYGHIQQLIAARAAYLGQG